MHIFLYLLIIYKGKQYPIHATVTENKGNTQLGESFLIAHNCVIIGTRNSWTHKIGVTSKTTDSIQETNNLEVMWTAPPPLQSFMEMLF